MARNRQPIAKKAKSLDFSPATMGYAGKDTRRKPKGNMRRKQSEYATQLNEKHCGGGKAGVSDRSISMPSWRTRILGVQLYYYNIEGFLHWGYNFYNSCQSRNVLDPFGYPDGGYFTPSGDCFLVYPGTDGEAWESLRLNALREAMDDIRALKLYEEKFGRAAAEELVLKDTDGILNFTHYPTNIDYLIHLREQIAKSLI